MTAHGGGGVSALSTDRGQSVLAQRKFVLGGMLRTRVVNCVRVELSVLCSLALGRVQLRAGAHIDVEGSRA